MHTSSRRLTEIAGTVCGVGALVVVGVLSGIDMWTVTIVPLSVHVSFFEGIVTIGASFAFVAITGAYVVWDVWRDNGPDPVLSGPDVQAIVPAYRDADIVDVCVESLVESAYDSLSVAVVVEPDDPTTRNRAEELAAEYDAVECLVNGDPGSKALAINHAVRESDADYFAVFDADESISPMFIPTAMGNLLGDVDVFQGRRIPRPTGVVETLAYCERLVVHTGYAAADLAGFTHCQSSSTAFTRTAFELAGGYDDKLTEDIDFSHKCYRANLTVKQDRSCANTMEAPHSVRDLWGQRKRWRIGHVEVVHSRIQEALDGDLGFDDILSIGRAAGGLMAGAFMLVVLSHILILTVQGIESAFLVPYGLVLATVGAVWLHDYRAGHVDGFLPGVFLVPLVYFGHGILTVKSFLEYYLTWEGEWYQVTKIGS
ncbi:MAG: biofilm PGA synthesis N-glycosyltransferase PgaC [Natronomonas sp.]|jgi:biofilm PGA synthesis N-glycosyltransferase PgaC|uniref:glycosyltransferase n=1 Tax=Natronomonas sp. TaxID=2184060 RepID=UPI0039898DD9